MGYVLSCMRVHNVGYRPLMQILVLMCVVHRFSFKPWPWPNNSLMYIVDARRRADVRGLFELFRVWTT